MATTETMHTDLRCPSCQNALRGAEGGYWCTGCEWNSLGRPTILPTGQKYVPEGEPLQWDAKAGRAVLPPGGMRTATVGPATVSAGASQRVQGIGLDPRTGEWTPEAAVALEPAERDPVARARDAEIAAGVSFAAHESPEAFVVRKAETRAADAGVRGPLTGEDRTQAIEAETRRQVREGQRLARESQREAKKD